MKTLERYVFGSFLTSFFLAFVVLSFVLTIGLMVQIVGYLLKGVPAVEIGRFAMVCLPETMQWTMPIALLVASVLVFSRMSADSEIAAMRACGVHLMSIMKWPLVFATCCTLLGLFINNELVPQGHEIRRSLARRISVGSGLDVLEPGRVISDFPKIKLRFDRKDGNWIYDLKAIDYSSKDVQRLIKAEKALVRTEGRNVMLDLYGIEVDPVDAEHPGLMRFGHYPYVVKEALKDSVYHRKEKDFRFFEMLGKIDEGEKSVDRAEGSSRVKNTEKYFAKIEVSVLKTEFMRRFVVAFASICFVLIGIPLGIRAQRRESTIGMAISIGVALGYFLIIILMGSLEKHFSVHPEYLLWLPVVICMALASYLIPKNL